MRISRQKRTTAIAQMNAPSISALSRCISWFSLLYLSFLSIVTALPGFLGTTFGSELASFRVLSWRRFGGGGLLDRQASATYGR